MEDARGRPKLVRSNEEVQAMDEEEKPKGFMPACAICGRVAAVLSLVLLVPVVRKRLARKHVSGPKRFLSFGH